MSFSEFSSEDSVIIPLAGFISADRHKTSDTNPVETDSDILATAWSLNSPKRKRRSDRLKKNPSLSAIKVENLSCHSESENEPSSKKDVVYHSPKKQSKSKSKKVSKRLSLPPAVPVHTSESDSESEHSKEVIGSVRKSPKTKSKSIKRELNTTRRSLPVPPVCNSDNAMSALDNEHARQPERKRSRLSLGVTSGKETDNAQATTPNVLLMRYECPDNYCQVLPINDANVAYTEDLEDDDVELWLCKIPIDIDVKALNGQSVNLNGSVSINNKKTKNSHDKSTELHFEELGNGQDFSLFTSLAQSKKDGHLHPVCKAITGLLTVRDSFSTHPYVLPLPRPKAKRELPPGLKQRYFPFGSDTPLKILKKKDKKKS